MLLRVQGCSLGMRVLTGAWGSPISWLTVYRNAFGPGWEQVSPPRHSGIHSRMHWAPGSGMDEGLDMEAPTEYTWSCQPRERSCCRALPRDSADPASPLQHPCPDPGQSQSPPHTHHAMQLLLRPGCVMSGQSEPREPESTEVVESGTDQGSNHPAMLHHPIRLCLQNTNSEIKLLRWQQQSINPKCGPLLKWGHCATELEADLDYRPSALCQDEGYSYDKIDQVLTLVEFTF